MTSDVNQIAISGTQDPSAAHLMVPMQLGQRAFKGNQGHSVASKGNQGRSHLMVLLELELGHSQRLLRRASSLAHGRACLPISPKTTRQLAISDHQGHSEALRGHQLACASLSSRCRSSVAS